MSAVAPGTSRGGSRSSTRTSHVPPWARASSQLASAATSDPACSGPVGEGAKRPRYSVVCLSAWGLEVCMKPITTVTAAHFAAQAMPCCGDYPATPTHPEPRLAGTVDTDTAPVARRAVSAELFKVAVGLGRNTWY